MLLKRIKARTLLSFSEEQLWNILTGKFILVFDDGELETNYRETLYSMYAWNFHRVYPNTPMLMKHHVRTVLGKKRLGSKTHLALLGNTMWSTYDTYVATPSLVGENFNEEEFRSELSEMVYRLTNKMYNELTYRLEEYVVSLDITDFIEVLNQPRIKEANANLQPTEESIAATYKIVEDVLENGVDLPNNNLSLTVRSKLASMGQVRQCVSARGFLTDTDSHLFRYPILRGYAQGIRSFYDSLIESRSAAKALIFSKEPLQQAEYFSRRLQLMTQIVRNLHHTDCGSTQYFRWEVKGPIYEAGRIIQPGDLDMLVGKNYLDETTNKLRAITTQDTHLIGTTIKLRAVIYCRHPDPYGICSCCFGQLSSSVPARTNIGHMCSTSMTQKSSQNVLSVKHLDGSSAVDPVVLDNEFRKFLKIHTDANSYLLSDNLKGRPVKLVIAAEAATSLTDIMEVNDVKELNITRISELVNVGILVEENGLSDLVSIPVNLGRRFASMTYAMLDYIRNKGWGFAKDGSYVIDMKDWDWSKPILTLPLKHFNMSDHSRDIATMLESSMDNLKKRDQSVTPDVALVELFNLVNWKLTVNLAVLEVIFYGSMITSSEKGDYSLPKPWTTREMGVMRLSMMNRSLAAAMAYEGHQKIIVSPTSYINTNRPDHPMDGILMPYEVFENR